jgi:hypothetical protein
MTDMTRTQTLPFERIEVTDLTLDHSAIMILDRDPNISNDS